MTSTDGARRGLRRARGDAATQAASAAGGPPIEVESLGKVYETRRGSVEAVRDATLRVDEGEFVSIIGPSGCGKSTVLKIVAGLIPYNEGRVLLRGAPAQAGRLDVGIMLQTPVLFPWRTVRDNVLLPAQVYELDSDAVRRRADELLTMVGLEGFADKYGWELSGGMQQRVTLARLLLLEPSILLLDEPFAALDELTRENLTAELAALHEQLRRAVLYVTHNIMEAVLLSDRVVVMKARPGEVLGVVDVDLPRPRSLHLLGRARTAELAEQVRTMLIEASDARPGMRYAGLEEIHE
jgi:NitT/TauT family transport system ATP-binding protein